MNTIKSYNETFQEKFGKAYEVKVEFDDGNKHYSYAALKKFDKGERVLVPVYDNNKLKIATIVSCVQIDKDKGDSLMCRKFVLNDIKQQQDAASHMVVIMAEFEAEYLGMREKEKKVKARAAEAKHKLKQERLKTALSEASTKAGDYLKDKGYSFKDVELRVLDLEDQNVPKYNPINCTDGTSSNSSSKELTRKDLEELLTIIKQLFGTTGI